MKLTKEHIGKKVRLSMDYVDLGGILRAVVSDGVWIENNDRLHLYPHVDFLIEEEKTEVLTK